MEDDTSQAAVSAIAALQKRLHDLEDERKKLTKQIDNLKSRVAENDSGYSRRERDVAEISARANKMLEDSAGTLAQIKEERKRNISLKNEIKDVNDELFELCQSSVSQTKSRNSSKKQMSSYDQVLKEYESLIGNIFEPPQLIGRKRPTSAKKSDNDIDLLPPNQRRLVKKLKELPASYSKQNIVMKRTIIQGLLCTREEVNRLADKIYKLEKKKCTSTTPRTISFDINKYSQQFSILTNEMKRFKFV